MRGYTIRCRDDYVCSLVVRVHQNQVMCAALSRGEGIGSVEGSLKRISEPFENARS
jgi:hypothetical protein